MEDSDTAVAQVIELAGGAATRAQLEARLQPHSITGQRLLRSLRRLEAAGLITFEGNTRARRYRLVRRPVAEDSTPAELTLAPESREALRALDQPPHLRRPASYERSFLDAYVPGTTWYLSEPLRLRLAALGKTPAAVANEPAGTWARHVLERFLIDLSWNSSRLEGNTYSLLDTERLLTEGRAAEGKPVLETQMLLNHKAAIEYLVGEPGGAQLDARPIQTLHALLLENLLGNPLDEGRLRATPVSIGGSTYVPLANPQLLEECFRQLVLTAQRIDDAFECAFFLLAHVPYLQPFIDGNKRTARLAANLPFIAKNLVPLSFADVPRDVFTKAYLALYESRRIEPLRDVFAWAYERSAQRLGAVRASVGEPDPFRLAHRAELRKLIAETVRGRLAPDASRAHAEAWANAHLPPAARLRFLTLFVLELEGLHDGNFGRYGLRPSEFEAWRASAPPRSRDDATPRAPFRVPSRA